MMIYRAIALGACILMLASSAPTATAFADMKDDFAAFNSKKEEMAKGNAENNESQILLDGVRYERLQIAWDFLNVAFSDTLPYEKTTRRPWVHLNTAQPDNGDSWATTYRTRIDGLPRHGVINKWVGEITVGIDWPKYKEADWQISRQRPSTEEQEADAKERKRFELHAKAIVDAIRRQTSLPITFVGVNEPREKTERYARIRIIPQDQTYLFNDYKFLSENFYNHIEEVTGVLQNFVGAVEFTPDARAQLDGFLVPEAGNAIGVSICRVLTVMPDEMLDTLMAECIVRSLGLPSMSKVNSRALVGHWNVADDVSSKTVGLDGREAVRFPGQFERAKRDLPITDFNRRIRQQGLTEYDATLLSLLYCDAIKPGMDKLAVIDVLSKQPGCLENKLGKR